MASTLVHSVRKVLHLHSDCHMRTWFHPVGFITRVSRKRKEKKANEGNGLVSCLSLLPVIYRSLFLRLHVFTPPHLCTRGLLVV